MLTNDQIEIFRKAGVTDEQIAAHRQGAMVATTDDMFTPAGVLARSNHDSPANFAHEGYQRMRDELDRAGFIVTSDGRTKV